jgi:hypothetical protein
MPEVRHNFTGGKMNKDLDERLVPNGQYRHALNVEVSTSEGSDVGTVQNILGNKRVDSLVGADFNCVGSIADEKNNKLYWFISKYDKDVILEYDIDHDIASPVLVDLKGGTGKAVLKFFGNTITGINIIDNLLFWSDNKGEPKKINIKRCKEGTVNINTHTQLSFSNNSFTGIAVEYVTSGVNPADGGYGFNADYHPPLTPIEKRTKIGKYSAYERRRLAAAVGVDFDAFVDDYGNIKDANNACINNSSSSSYDADGNSSTGNLSGSPYVGYNFKARHYRDGELLGGREIRVFDNLNGLHLRYDPSFTEKDFKIGDVIFAENTKLDIEEKHITVIKPKPLKAPSVKINYKEQTKTTNKKPNLFEEQFPRFSYRYKYADGEFSAFAPFTEPVFNPQYTQNTDKSTDGSVLYSKDNAYSVKDPKNKAMVNAIHSVDLMDFITINTPEDVVEVDLLYKKEDSPVIYSIGTVKHTDFEWHASAFNYEHGQSFVGGQGRYNSNMAGTSKTWLPAADGGYNSGKYTVKNENIYAALPANQLLRPWDNVPRKALAQEVSGNRIVYGNYLQNYTVGSKPKVFVDYNDRKKTIGSFDTKGLPSIKSQRNYQLGVIYSDEFGRETPVFTSSGGAVNVPWESNGGVKNASKSNQMIASVENNFPDWVDSVKFFIKENSGEYYNLVMERAWTGKSTYELDNSEGHLWMSFPSSDRNKISKEDSIVLKRKIGVGEEQIGFENKFSVIDIQDEAPDAIKYELVNLGTVVNNSANVMTVSPSNYDRIFSHPGQRPDKLQDTIILDISSWTSGGQYRDELMAGETGISDNEVPENLYVSWSRSGGASSSKYKVSGGWKGTAGYVLKLNRDITEKDADIAHVNGNSVRDTSEAHVHEDLILQVEKRIAKDDENFSGQFFVKISKNHITGIVETGNELSNLDKFQVTADQGVWYWKDDTNGSQVHASNPFSFQGGSPYGLTNYFGDTTSHIASNNIQGSGGGNLNQNAMGTTARLTDWHEMWENILGELDGKPRWFVDSMHMASGQSDESDYAKYNCVTWAGATFKPNLPLNDDNLSKAWSYPPLKKWFTEVTENEIEVEADEGTYWTSDNVSSVISTSNLFDANDSWLAYDDDLEENVGLQIDGWIGVPQNVSRVNYPQTTAGKLKKAENHVNGLEGMVTTNEYHVTGPRRWVSGMNGVDYGNGEDTRTYSSAGDETEKHFMHLSFFAPGKDLHDNTWHFDEPTLYGKNTWMDNLQGVWGGGVFTGTHKNQKFGSGSDDVDKHFHLAMEGNYAAGEDNDHQVYSTPPGPGSGFGYNLDYRELHERQWDPTFNSEGDPEHKIRDFIRNLHPGSRFRFNFKKPGASGAAAVVDDEVYTVKKVQLKKLYNHTSWRTPHNQFFDSIGGYVWTDTSAVHDAYNSVEDMALIWLNNVDVNGEHSLAMSDTLAAAYGNTQQENFKKKIVDFGAAHNRRVCYIIELDKNPATWGNESGSALGNPLNSPTNPQNTMSADLVNDNYTHIEFLDPVQDIVLKDLSKFPAIWELSPKKQEVDLDIYYEASNNIPVRINRHTNELFAPKGCLVEMVNPPSNHGYGDVRLVEWDDNTAILEPGFDKGDSDGEVDYSGVKFKFVRRDGSYTVAESGLQQLTTEVEGYKTRFVFKRNISSKIQVGLAWYNCFSFGNGLESNRIRDGFNSMFITNGVKASTTVQETYQEEHRKHGIIYSGLYNSNSGINDLNQFIMAEKITKDLNPTYGSIQKLFSRDTDLIAFCEDKVLKILANKDALYNADGNPQLTSNQNVLGQAVPFQGEYGISKNPESFASESYRAYFTDKQRGAVLRLSKDGLTPISKAGMHDWFRDNLSKHTSLVGTYDSYKENYNITLSNTYTENIIFNTYFKLGAESVPLDATVLSAVTGGAPISGSAYEHSWETKNILTSSQYNFNSSVNSSNAVDPMFKHDVTVTNHPAIPMGHFQQAVTASTPTPTANIAVVSSSAWVGYIAPTAAILAQDAILAQAAILAQDAILAQAAVAGIAEIPFLPATYQTTPGTDSGWWYDPRFTSVSSDLFGASNTNLADPGVYSIIKRVIGGISITESSNIGQNNVYPNWYSGMVNASVEKPIHYPITGVAGSNSNNISQAITRNSNSKAIVFDRPDPIPTSGAYTYVEFKNIGNYSNPSGFGAGVNSDYLTNGVAAGLFQGQYFPVQHKHFYNGDEIHIQLELKCYATTSNEGYGYNYIMPKLELFDGGSPVDGSYIMYTGEYGSHQSDAANYSTSYNPYTVQTYVNDMGSDFDHSSGGGYHLEGSEYVQGGLTHASSGKTDTYCGNNSIIWPITSQISALSGGSSGAVKTVICRVSFKFTDGGITQGYNGTPINTTISQFQSTGVPDITETKVISDLRIRVSNAHPKATSGYNTIGSSTNKPLRHQLWEINKLLVKKGYGVTAPHQNFVAGTPAQDAILGQDAILAQAAILAQDAIIGVAYDPGFAGVYTEWFDNVETNAIESLTTAQIIAGGGALVNGNWVLNQSAIDAWNNTYPGGVIYAQDNIPSYNVPAFVAVLHGGGNWQKGAYNTGSGASQWYNTYTSPFFGNNRTAVPDSAYRTNQANGTTGSLVSWYKPGPDPSGQSGQEGNYGNTSQFDKTLVDGMGQSFSPPGQAALPAIGASSSTPVTKTYSDFVVDYWRVKTGTDAGSQSYSMHFPLGTDDELQAGEWYMVDVELQDTLHPNQYDYNNGVPPSGFTNNGSVAVKGVGSESFTNNYNYGESGGWGLQSGGSTDFHVMCVPAWRTRYDSGNPRWVLRAIFKLETDSWVHPSNLDRIILRFYYVNPNPMYVNKVICKKVSYKNNTGSATSWSRPGIYGGTDHHLQRNAFSESKLYYHSQALCYDEVKQEDNYLNGTSGGAESWWNQEFDTGKEVTNTGNGWILNLKVGANPKTNLSFSDNANSKLGVKVTGPIGEYSPVTYPGQFTGILCQLEHEGEYQIKFDMTGTFNNNWSISKGGSPYAAPLFSEYSQTPSGDPLWSNTNTGQGISNAIGFYNAVGNVPLSCSIFDVYLTQTETIFSGGQAGSWGFDGFDSTSEQFITWDIYWPDGQVGTNADGRIQFANCPLFDPSFGSGNTMISANQYIDKVINRYEKYEISFNFNMETQNEEGATISGQGLFHMYYFNGSGYGFRINDIGDNPGAPNYTKTAVTTDGLPLQADESNLMWWRVTKIVGIGDGSTPDDIAYSEFQHQNVEALRDTLVIRKDDSSVDVTGWIDDISMKRVYDVEMTPGPDGIPGNEDDIPVYPETTLTFSEGIKGWTSFKSFIPESGVSLSKKYFTFKDGYLYQHYKPLKLNEDNVHWDDCNYIDAENYNHFYDHLPVSEHNYSEIVAVINVEPNVVKTFNTLSYEGSQAHVTNPGATALQKPKLINQNNALAWALNDYNATPVLYPNIDGWKCVDIKTDLDDGQLLDFIKKEGKWFGYVRGKHIVGQLDTSKFSVQGLGRISNDDITS